MWLCYATRPRWRYQISCVVIRKDIHDFVCYFACAIAVWRQYFWKNFRPSTKFAALVLNQQDTTSADAEENKRALDLVERAVILWLAVIAVLTLFSWIA